MPFLAWISRAQRQVRSVFSVAGILILLSLPSIARATPITGDISIGGSVSFNKNSLTKASSITGWMNPRVLGDSGSFVSFATPGSGVTMSTPWFFATSTPSFVLWTVDGFTFDLTSSSIVSRSRKSISVDGTGTVTGDGFDQATGEWTFTYSGSRSRGKHHRSSSGFLFSFTADTQVIAPPFQAPPGGTPPPGGNPPTGGTPPPVLSGPEPGPRVPDNGSTLVLLSFGLLGLVFFRSNQVQPVPFSRHWGTVAPGV